MSETKAKPRVCEQLHCTCGAVGIYSSWARGNRGTDRALGSGSAPPRATAHATNISYTPSSFSGPKLQMPLVTVARQSLLGWNHLP